MIPPHFIPHPQNALGEFYVVHRECISCEAPVAEAPALLDWAANEPPHCIFKAQPKTAEEEFAIRAMCVCCIQALRYRGTNLQVLARLQELGLSHLCGALLVKE